MLARGRMAVRDTARYWWVFLVSGILWLIIAWVVLRMDQTSVVAVGVLLGAVFLFAVFKGFSQIFLAFSIRHAGKEAAAGLPA